MFKCIVYDEDNKRKILRLKVDREEEVFQYAKSNKLKIIEVKKVKDIFCRKKLKDKDLKVFSKVLFFRI